MKLVSNARSLLLAGSAMFLIAACTQGEDIASPGATNPGTPPSGGGGGGGGSAGDVSGDTCPTGFSAGEVIDLPSGPDQVTCDVAGTLLTNTALIYKDDDGDGIPVAYRINGRLDVGQDVGFDGSRGDAAVLTIQPGVTLFGQSGSDYVVVNRGSRIEAEGSETAPIVFTSRADLEAGQTDRADAIGEWGGLVILGRAPINKCSSGVLGQPSCSNTIEGVTAPEAQYGGGLPADNSGTLKYVQVRFAGFPISAGNELNGISFGGVGNGTTVDFVQVHNNSDDGIEMFGGTANLKHIVLTGNDDDSLDTDSGWTGRAQFVLVAQAEGRGDNGFEMSSAGAGFTPATNPMIANYTIVSTTRASGGGRGQRLNSGHIGRFMNGVVKDSTEACLRWDDPGNDNDTYDGLNVDPTFQSVIFDCVGGLERSDPDKPGAVAAVNAAGSNNQIGGATITSNFQAGSAETMSTAVAVESVDPFFEQADYLGAFGPEESETNNWATGWTFQVFTDNGCPTGTTETGDINGTRVCLLTGDQDSDITLTRGNYFELDGRVDIGIDVGFDGAAVDGKPAVLTIEPGVKIFGNSGSDYLVVNRGSEIRSNGTRNNPVVMTSEADVRGTTAPNLRLDTIGEWGGLVILGRAPINDCATGTVNTPSCQNNIEGVTAPEASYGGGVPGDSSGSLTYTLVKFAGFPISPGNELNGISFGGVGSGTNVNFVQVHNNSDDGIEMFGGTANLRHIVLTGNDDDSLDTDQGWNGFAQYVIVKQRDGRGDNGFEMSSTGAGVTPATDPTIANFTILSTDRASGGGRGIRLNSGHIGRFINGIVTDTTQQCLRWEDAGSGGATYDAAADPVFNNSLFDCPTISTSPVGEAAIAADSTNTTTVDVNLLNGFINDSAAAGRAGFTNLPGVNAFFDDVSHIGAVEDASDDWWADWTCGLEADDC